MLSKRNINKTNTGNKYLKFSIKYKNSQVDQYSTFQLEWQFATLQALMTLINFKPLTRIKSINLR